MKGVRGFMNIVWPLDHTSACMEAPGGMNWSIEMITSPSVIALSFALYSV